MTLDSKWRALPRDKQDRISGFLIGLVVGSAVRTVLSLVPAEEFHYVIYYSYVAISSGMLFLAIMIGIYNVFKREDLYHMFFDSFVLGFVLAFEISGIIKAVVRGELALP